MSDTTVVKCTNFCGFSVTGTPEYCRELFDSHQHQEHPDSVTETRWHESVFSFWGVITALVIGAIIVSVVTKTPW